MTPWKAVVSVMVMDTTYLMVKARNEKINLQSRINNTYIEPGEN